MEAVAKKRANCYKADLLSKGLQADMVLRGSGSDLSSEEITVADV